MFIGVNSYVLLMDYKTLLVFDEQSVVIIAFSLIDFFLRAYV